MVTKKKDVAYVGYSNPNSTVPIVEQKISQIPPYEDSGIQYKGKFKVQKGMSEYELKAQQTRFYTLYIPPGSVAGTYTIPKQNNLRFFASTMIVQASVSVSTTEITICDGVTSNPRGQFLVNSANPLNLVIPLPDSPRPFLSNNFLVTIDSNLAGLTDFVNISLYGWEEQE